MPNKKVTATLITLASLVAAPTVSLASASGYQYWGGFTANIGGQSVGIPAGQLHHAINGKGTRINWQGANFGSAANICDSSMRFTYGYGKRRINGNIHRGCSRVGQWKYKINANVPKGDACAELWAKRWRVLVAKQCHYVH
ncbi:hypothetical protein [Myxacorys almedinensis]|uniref:Uncharacterized protein n=1 Tax=Myxacorys almedinensis A TaxID=2690445 RepID=A0A8J7Z1A3_9CYAN|nr:hypothetical protein [Myxacorys almedinensis]NDJ16313.1 hypothetical protein [Myxacorys almedinensis A]